MYWIESSEHQEHDFPDLAKAKRRAGVLRRRRQDKGELYPLVHVHADDNSAAWHWDTLSGGWHVDTH